MSNDNDVPTILLHELVDGRPNMSWLVVGGVVVMVALGAVEIWNGMYLSGFESLLFAVMMYLTEARYIQGWKNGYRSVVNSLYEQLPAEKVADSND